MSELLAKSRREGTSSKTLREHTVDVMEAARWLFGVTTAPTRLGREWIRFFKLDARHNDAFFDSLLMAAGLHDWGKGSTSFQMALSAHAPQVIRHEHLSGLLQVLPQVEEWLRHRPTVDSDVVLAAVISHHLKAARKDLGTLLPTSAASFGAVSFGVAWESSDFQGLLADVAARLGISAVTMPNPPPKIWGFGPGRHHFDLSGTRRRLLQRLDAFEDALAKDERRRRLLWAVRSALIVADAAGSAVPRMEPPDIKKWIADAFDESKILTKDDIWTKVIRPRIGRLKRAGRWNEDNGRKGWNQFQVECGRLASPGLLLAPCAAGKTLAAWLWIAEKLGERPAARVIFLYPTRGTASEGFRDYVSWAPEADAALIHGTARYDLDGMFQNPDDTARRFAVDERLFALAYWRRRIFSATVDQFLGFLTHQYGATCLLPVLVDSVVVFDEIHSYDRGLFAGLKEFLRIFDVPVLTMTATLQNARREDLERTCGVHVYGDRKPVDLQKLSDTARYRVATRTAHEIPALVRAMLANQKRVLWVVNTVKRAQRWAEALAAAFPAEELRDSAGVPIYSYHSRFKLRDRRERHRAVVDAFRADQREHTAVLAVTTQVCEMSLDLDADVLITEHAPITALVQRMGRCNRIMLPDKGYLGEVFVYPSEESRPYKLDELRGAAAFVADMAGLGVVCQSDLESLLEKHDSAQVEPDRIHPFTTTSPYASSLGFDLRDIDDFYAPAVLAGDIGKYLRAKKPERAAFIVPVPRRSWLAVDKPKGFPAYLIIAPDDHYHASVGFRDEALA
ncbi:MAG TPA: CRISPR-associated helicase Cas3' [Pirellulales bacterium]|nr:CRISPR-associated helicase Cas3' [Pirellulales bacterium]